MHKLVLIAFLSAGAVVQPQSRAVSPEADLILLNGKILTVDPKDSVAEAVGIAGGKVVAVGSNEEVRKRAAKDAHLIDLHGRTATPGLIDTHCHFQEVAALYEIDLSDPSIRQLSDVVQRVQQKVAEAKPGAWVRGSGWDEGKLTELRYVYAADLDKVSPNNPVWLMHTTGHYGVANSYAMRLAGITRDSKNPPAGTIDRDLAGNPTGVLKESAKDLVTARIPAYTREQQRSGLLKIIADFNKEGMTGVKDPGIGPEEWSRYRELQAQGKLTVRVFALFLAGTTLDSARQTLHTLTGLPRPPQSYDGRLLAGGVKIFMDGSGGARTAWMHQEWHKNSNEKDTGNYGYPALDPEIFRQQVKMFHDAGIHVSTHAVGDRAIDWVVDTYAEALQAKPARGLRHGIIHCNTPTDHAIETMARLQRQYDAGYPEAQAPFMWWIGDTYAGNLGPERCLRLMPFRTYLAKGIHWGGGSDYSVTPFPARYGLWSSVARRPLRGVYGTQPFGGAEAIDVHAALRSYTIWAAHQLFLEDRIGSIEPGKDADIAVWDRDLYTIPSGDIPNIKCELTLVGGRIVYRAEGAQVKVR